MLLMLKVSQEPKQFCSDLRRHNTHLLSVVAAQLNRQSQVQNGVSNNDRLAGNTLLVLRLSQRGRLLLPWPVLSDHILLDATAGVVGDHEGLPPNQRPTLGTAFCKDGTAWALSGKFRAPSRYEAKDHISVANLDPG